MTKQEFMYRLAQQLISLPPEERVCALTFYDEYFADAGEENVEQVIRELGSPEEVARTIKEDFAQRNPGYDPNSPQQPYRPGPQYQPGRGRQTYTTNPGESRPQSQGEERTVYKKGMSAGGVILIVVLLLVGSPIWLTLLGLIIALVVGLVGVILAVALGLGGMVVGLLAGGIGCLWSAATAAVLTPGLRLLGIGGGLLLLGVGLLAMTFCVWLVARILPALFRGFVELCRRPFHRKGGAQ
jgi:uncharacterized membrane protein